MTSQPAHATALERAGVDPSAAGIVPAAGPQWAAYLEARRDFVRGLVTREATDAEFDAFLELAKARGLNPFLGQIYLVSRWDSRLRRKVATPQTGIDGLRLIAQRSGAYRGQRGPVWAGPEGEWRDAWTAEDPPAAARVGVLRDGFAEPLWAVASWRSYVQTDRDGKPTPFWARLPDVMLAKCAEALALRRAFPEETSGLYIPEEMGSGNPDPGAARAAGDPVAERRAETLARLSDVGREWRPFLQGLGVERWGDLRDEATWSRVDAAIADLEGAPDWRADLPADEPGEDDGEGGAGVREPADEPLPGMPGGAAAEPEPEAADDAWSASRPEGAP